MLDELRKISTFIDWFKDNFFDENYLNDEEEWVPYSKLPEYIEAKEALYKLVDRIV